MAAGKSYQPVKPGQQLKARDVNNNLVRGPQRGQAYSGNVNRRNFPDGVAVDLPNTQTVASASVYQKHAKIIDLFDDYYEVQTYNNVDGDVTGASFYAAKPYNQQITTFPLATEQHEVNDIILILKAVSNIVVGGEHLQWVEAGSGGGGSTIKSAADKTALTAIMSEGDIGYTTGTTKRFYVRVNSTTICISHLE